MRVKDGFILREIDNTGVVVAVGEQSKTFKGLITLNDTGIFLWNLLEQETTKEDMLAKMLSEYEVEEAEAASDLEFFLSKARDAGLLEE